MSKLADSLNEVNLLLKSVRAQARSADPRDRANAHVCLALADAYEEAGDGVRAARWREVVRFMDAYTSHLYRYSPGRSGPRHFFAAVPVGAGGAAVEVRRISPVGWGRYQSGVQCVVSAATGVVRTGSTARRNARVYDDLAAYGDALGLAEYLPALSVAAESELGRVLEGVQ